MLTITVHPQDMEQSLVHSRTRTTYVWFQSFALFSHPPGLPSEDRVLEEFRGSRGLLWVDWSEKASWRKGDGSTKMSPRSPVPGLLIILSPNQVPLSPSDEMALNLSCTCFHLHLAYGRKELHAISPKTMASTFFSRHSQVFPGTSVLYPPPTSRDTSSTHDPFLMSSRSCCAFQVQPQCSSRGSFPALSEDPQWLKPARPYHLVSQDFAFLLSPGLVPLTECGGAAVIHEPQLSVA